MLAIHARTSDLAAAASHLDFLAQAVASSAGRQLAFFLHKPLFDASPAETAIAGRFANPAARRRLLAAFRRGQAGRGRKRPRAAYGLRSIGLRSCAWEPPAPTGRSHDCRTNARAGPFHSQERHENTAPNQRPDVECLSCLRIPGHPGWKAISAWDKSIVRGWEGSRSDANFEATTLAARSRTRREAPLRPGKRHPWQRPWAMQGSGAASAARGHDCSINTRVPLAPRRRLELAGAIHRSRYQDRSIVQRGDLPRLGAVDRLRHFRRATAPLR